MSKQRIRRVMDNLEAAGLSQALICDPMSIKYLTGYYTFPHERFFALYLSDKGTTLFCNKLFPDATGFADRLVTFSDTDDPLPLVAAACERGAALGVDKNLPARWLLPLMDLGAAQGFSVASDAVDAARSAKDEEERALMREASRLNDVAMGWLAAQVHEGVTERAIAEGLLGAYRRLGSEGYSFDPIVSFGANAADPHHESDDTAFVPGQTVLFDVGCIWQGYCSDMTRTFFTAEPNAHQLEVYETVRRANEAAAAIVAPGVEFAKIDGVARGIITDAGYGPYFTHRLGHQIGLEVHEPGDVSGNHHEPVRPGQIFSIEPGIYLEGDIGVRIEDLCLVTEDGHEILNHYPHEAIVLQV
ncbi:MAG: Xaa-Pro peptidase family protein [Coriobacteriales bacterium]|nr:Xaa-Pro peptidase family protein [Coriobacteriales bacterium]